MRYRDLEGNTYGGDNGQDRLLRRIYEHRLGREIIRILTCPGISRAAGRLLDQNCSKWLIRPFVKNCRIDLTIYETKTYVSFNDFFTRKIRREFRRIDGEETHLVSPSDGKVCAYALDSQGSFTVKETCYTVESILRDKKLAERYQKGYAVIIRLSVDDYHRYCYPAAGEKSRNRHIEGILHTVNPAACERVPVYKENTREYTLLKTRQFGTILQMEVGALLVGRIVNDMEEGTVEKGQEKGRFEYGGSTIVLLMEGTKARPREIFLKNTLEGYETQIHMGEWMGESIEKK